MSLPLVFRPDAQAEFDAAAAWCDGQQPGLGDDFVAEVQRVLDVIANQPERFPVADGMSARHRFPVFPTASTYRDKPTRIVVIAVFHMSRDPVIWQGRK